MKTIALAVGILIGGIAVGLGTGLILDLREDNDNLRAGYDLLREQLLREDIQPVAPPVDEVARAGPIGPQGVQGLQGPRGLQGPIGSQGIPGSIGPQGIPGINGEPGPVGASGEPGENGTNGEAGPAGPQGEQGIQGEPGLPPEQWTFSFMFLTETYNFMCTDPERDGSAQCQQI